MVKKDLKVGDLIKIMKITQGDANRAGYVDDMEKYIGKTSVITEFAGECPGINWNWELDRLYFDPRDVRRIRKVKPVAPIAPEAAAKAEKSLLNELIDLCKKDGGVGLCSFAWQWTNGKKEFAVMAACHARLMYRNVGHGVQSVALAMYDYLERNSYKEAYKAHVKYIIQDSPWAHIFNEKDIDVILKSGVTLNTDVPCNNIMAACVALREGNEFPQHLRIFKGILDAGFSGHTAYVVSRGFHGTMDKPKFVGVENGHKVLSSELNAEELAQFFIKGYKNNKGLYKEGHSDYGIAKWIASGSGRPCIGKFLTTASVVTVVDGPFGKENKRIETTESLLDVCKRFEEMLNKWRAE